MNFYWIYSASNLKVKTPAALAIRNTAAFLHCRINCTKCRNVLFSALIHKRCFLYLNKLISAYGVSCNSTKVLCTAKTNNYQYGAHSNGPDVLSTPTEVLSGPVVRMISTIK